MSLVQYIGVKLIGAVPMGLLEAEKLLERNVGYKGNVDQNGDAPGYFVEYGGGYKSWSPEKEFEAAYRPTSGMTFGLAVEALKLGKKVARAGWNGKGMWLSYVSGGAYDVGCAAVGFDPYKPETAPKKLPWIGMRTADNWYVPWLASQTDVLAEDWMIVE